MLENIFVNKDEVDYYFRRFWMTDLITGEVHQVINLEADENGETKFVKFIDGSEVKGYELFMPANIFVLSGMEDHPEDKPYQVIFSGQFIKITKFNIFGDISVEYDVVEKHGPTKPFGSCYNIDVVSPEEYYINTSSVYREMHPDLAKKYYLGITEDDLNDNS